MKDEFDFPALPAQRENPLDLRESVRAMVADLPVFAEETSDHYDPWQYYFQQLVGGKTWVCRAPRYALTFENQPLFQITGTKREAVEHFRQKYPTMSGPCDFYWTSSMSEAQWIEAWGDQLARRVLALCDLVPGSDGKTLKNAACYLANREGWAQLNEPIRAITDALIVSELQRKPSPYFDLAVNGLRNHALSDDELGKMAAKVLAEPDPTDPEYNVITYRDGIGIIAETVRAVSAHMAMIEVAASSGFDESLLIFGCYDENFIHTPAEEGGTYCYAADFDYRAMEAGEDVA